MVKNAGEMQKNVSDKLRQQRASGEAGGGLAKVVMNGHFEVESLVIDDSLLKEDKAFVEEVIKASINDATTQLRSGMADYFKSLAGSFGL